MTHSTCTVTLHSNPSILISYFLGVGAGVDIEKQIVEGISIQITARPQLISQLQHLPRNIISSSEV